jgi:hypothetical protein
MRLPDVRNACSATNDDRAFIGDQFSRDDAQESRLTRAVGSHQGSSFAPRQRECYAFEQSVLPVTKTDIGDLKDRHFRQF